MPPMKRPKKVITVLAPLAPTPDPLSGEQGVENAQQSDHPISTTPPPSSQPQQPKPGSVAQLKSVIFTPDVEADIVD